MSNKRWDEDSESSDDDNDSVVDDNQPETQEVSQQQSESSTTAEITEKLEKTDVNTDNYQLPSSKYILFIGNLSYGATSNDLGQFFTDGGCQVEDAHIYEENGKSRGNGVVILSNEESYQHALNANGQDMFGRRITVRSKDQKRSNNGRNDRGYNSSRPTTGRGDARNRDDRPRDGHRDRPRDNKDYSRNRDDRPRDDRPRDDRPRDDRRGGRGDRDRGEGRGGRGRERDQVEKKETENATPAVRPVLKIQPRTLPVEKVGEVTGSSSLFGEGKPRDELAYEVFEFISFSF